MSTWENDYGWEDNDFLSKPGKNKKHGNFKGASSAGGGISSIPSRTPKSFLQPHSVPGGHMRDLSPLGEKKYEGKTSSLHRTRAQHRKSKLFYNNLDAGESSDGDEDIESSFSPLKNADIATPQKVAAPILSTPQKLFGDSAPTPRSTSQKMKRGGSGAVDSVKSKALAALSSSTSNRFSQPSPSKVLANNQQHGAYLPETHNKLMQSPYYRALFAASNSVEQTSSTMPPSLQPPPDFESHTAQSPDTGLKRLAVVGNMQVGTPNKADPCEEMKLEKLLISVPEDEDHISTPSSIYWPPLSSSHLCKDEVAHTPSQRGRTMLRTPLRTPALSRNVSYNSTSSALESASNLSSLGVNSPFRQDLSSSLFMSSAAVLEKETPKPALPSFPSAKSFMSEFPKADQLPKVETMRLARSLFDRLIGDKQSKAVQSKKTKRWDDPDSEDDDVANKDDNDSDDDKYLFEDFQSVLEDFHLPSPLLEVKDESVKVQPIRDGEASAQEGLPVKLPQPSKCFLFAASSNAFFASDSAKNIPASGKINPTKKKKLNYDLIDFVWFHQLLLSSSYINQDYLSLSEAERAQHSLYIEILLQKLIKKSFYFDLTTSLTLEDDRFDSSRLELLKIIYESSPHLLYLDPDEEEESQNNSGRPSISTSGSEDCSDDEDNNVERKSIDSSSQSNPDREVSKRIDQNVNNKDLEIEISIRQIMANAVEHACGDRWQRCLDSTFFATCSELDSNFLAKRGFTQQLIDQPKALVAAELDYSLHAVLKSADERPPYKVWDHDRNMIELMKHMIKREVKSCVNRLLNQEEDERIWLRSTECLRSLSHGHQFMLRCYGHRLGQTSELVENQRLLALLLDVLEGLLIWDFTLKIESLALSSKDEGHHNHLSTDGKSFDAVRDYLGFIQRRWRLSCDTNSDNSSFGLQRLDIDKIGGTLNYAQEIIMAKSLEVVLIFGRVLNAWRGDDEQDDNDNSPQSSTNNNDVVLRKLQDVRQSKTKDKMVEILIHRCIRKFVVVLGHSDHVKLIQNVLNIIQNESLLDSFFFGNGFDHNESRLFELADTLRTLRSRHWNPAIRNSSSICLDLIVDRMNQDEENEDYD